MKSNIICSYSGSGVHGSVPPLTAEAVSLIKKETPALRSHIRGLPCSFHQLTLNREPLNFEPEQLPKAICGRKLKQGGKRK